MQVVMPCADWAEFDRYCSCVLFSMLAYANPPTSIHVLMNTMDPPSSDLYGIVLSASRMAGVNIVVHHFQPDASVGAMKASVLPGLPHDRVILTDCDVLIPQHTFDRLRGFGHYPLVVFSSVDVDDRRGYKDYTADRLRVADMSGVPERDWPWRLWEHHRPVPFVGPSPVPIAKSVCSVSYLSDSGILDRWRAYPKHVRGHDQVFVDGMYFAPGCDGFHFGIEEPHLSGRWAVDPFYDMG